MKITLRLGLNALVFGLTVTPAVLPCRARDTSATAAQTSLATRSVYQLGGTWTDAHSRPTALSDFRGRPVVIAMFFSRCGSACPLTVATMKRIRDALPARVRAKAAFVLVSFDSTGDGPAELREYCRQYDLDLAAWTLLHGAAEDVRALAMTLGVQYTQTAPGFFAHSNSITVLDREGCIAFQGAPSVATVVADADAAVAR